MTSYSSRWTPRCALGALFHRRGASTVEYVLLLVALLLVAGGAWKTLGGSLAQRSTSAGDIVSGGASGASAGAGGSSLAGGSRGGGSVGGGSRGSGESPKVASKVNVGGVGGASGEGGGRVASSDHGASAQRASTEGADPAEGFGAKRWFGIGLLAAGLLAGGYVLASMRRAKKLGDALGPQGSSPHAPRGPTPPPSA